MSAAAAHAAAGGDAGRTGARDPARGNGRDHERERERAARPTLLQALQQTLLDVGGSFVERVELFMLELERAGRAAAQIVALVVVAAVLGVTAWLGVWALAAALLLTVGVPVIVVMAVVVVINAAAAWVAWRRARGLFGMLGLPATRRQLRVGSKDLDAVHPDPSSVHAQDPNSVHPEVSKGRVPAIPARDSSA